jgi:hypothetical protein
MATITPAAEENAAAEVNPIYENLKKNGWFSIFGNSEIVGTIDQQPNRQH